MTMSNDIHPYELARMAGVQEPDSDTSAGAEFLLAVASAAAEVRSDWEDDESFDVQDAISEQADACVPVYTHPRWETFVDLCAYTVESDVESSGDMTADAGVRLFTIAERVLAELLSDIRED